MKDFIQRSSHTSLSQGMGLLKCNPDAGGLKTRLTSTYLTNLRADKRIGTGFFRQTREEVMWVYQAKGKIEKILFSPVCAWPPVTPGTGRRECNQTRSFWRCPR